MLSLRPAVRWPRSALSGMALLLFLAGGVRPALSQVAPVNGKVVPVELDSGLQANRSSATQVAFQRVLDLGAGVPWIRVFFAEATLSPASKVRVTSLLDRQSQTLDARGLARWRNATAFFNGGAVRIELLSAPGATADRIRIVKVAAGVAGEPKSTKRKSICGVDDGRVPSGNPAVGRLLAADLGGGCTGTLIDCGGNGVDKCHISAGHCFVAGVGAHQVSTVIQFDVPASQADCGLVHPPVDKQFPIDPDSVIATNGGPGSDWAVFRALPNSAGRTPFEEQGAALKLATSVPTAGTVRVTGFGVDGNEAATGGSNAACACDPTAGTGRRHEIQQTATGALVSGPAGEISHSIDTCGGNSGSAIVLESSGEVIGVHTHGGCDTGNNTGTEITLDAFEDALASCKPHLLVLLDRTGSMVVTRPSTGNTRCADALDLAKQDVHSFFAKNAAIPGATVAVWTFAGNAATDLTGGFVDEAAAMGALNGLSPAGCTGSTPLAEAICAGSDALELAFRAAGPSDKLLAISSDGEENNSDGPCAGPASAGGPPYDAGSWQRKVRDKLLDRNVVLARYWGSVQARGIDVETGQVKSAKAVSDAAFFEDLAASTGGVFQGVRDSDPLPPPFVVGGGGTQPEPIPALSTWGLVATSLLLALAGGGLLARRRAASR